MSHKNHYIQLQPQGRKIKAKRGKTLIESLIHQSIFLRTDCGGKGNCGKCQVNKVTENKLEPIKACTFTVNENISIEIPETSRLSSHIMSKAPLSFPDAFKDRFKQIQMDGSYGIATDLGTTTIAIYLCNIAKGEVVSSVAIKNPQSLYGDDVMSRISAVSQNEGNLEHLQKLVIKSIEWGIKELWSSFCDDNISISRMVVVGNPAMIHILSGIDPGPIGISPYQPSFYDAKLFSSKQSGFEINDFSIQTLPNVSGFIGGDIIAAALAVEIDDQPDGTLLIDLGTNGELMLKSRDQLYATSCATGPAFEGATLSCGMQAIPGAINSIEIGENQDIIRYSTISLKGGLNTQPVGICGAGVINGVAQFCEKQIINPNGKFTSNIKEYIIVAENSAIKQSSVYITQKDIRSVQLGKSALITGIEFLLKEAGLEKPEKIILAGAFGSHLNKLDMIRLGMIPEIDLSRIETSGNSAGSGAIMALCDNHYIEKAVGIADRIKTIDLACNLDFQEKFIKNLNFPSNKPF
ncbi:MAG: DUF4445 domain-containing protein [Desulfobulbaceae bacterium]|nr:DUF4445 domain-containing protein [Desulfobulbaceae bacterium]